MGLVVDAAVLPHPKELVDNLGYGGARGDVVERLECGLADPTPSRVNRGSSRRPSPRHQTSEEIEEVLDAKCAQLLSTSARISLAYYRNEYETRAMTVDALVAVLLELLDTPHKYALLGHLRSSIRPEDLDKFDDLLYRRKVQAAWNKETQQQVQLQLQQQQQQHQQEQSGMVEGACRGAGLPSEDSDVGLASGGGGLQQGGGSRRRRPPFRRHSSGGESGDKQPAVEDRRWSSVSEPPMDPDVDY
ncbi:whirlin-like [Rhipicephalus microplus]|uniref:whirlin-like n=1 Tax=Rhipicephalus microplus TaxID=6941 RepID=UPI003F6B5FA8